jgi:DHA2 family multidrug resistance protein-like MFS transporter
MADTAAVALHERPEIHERRWFLLGVMCLSLVLVVMAVSGLNVALPSLQRSLGASATDLQWIVDSYALVFAGLLLSAGAIGDRVGRKRALVAGLGVFGAGALVGTLAGSPGAVIGARVVMGVGAAFIMPATLSLLTTVFPPHERRKAIAIWAGFAGAGGALGPLVVGFLLTEWWIFPAHWWGSAFLVNTVAVTAVLVAVLVFAPESRDEDATPLDPLGAVLSLVGLTGLLYGIIEGPERGWTDGGVMVGFAVAAVALGAFAWWELRAEHPMLPMQYFRNRGFSTGSGVITFAFLVMFGFFFLVTQYLQLVRGYSPLDAGVATLPFAATMIAVSPRSAVLGERFGVLRVMSMGFLLVVIGLGVMAVIEPDTPYVVIAGGLVLLSSGMAITLAPATGSIMSAVPLNKAGVGSAVNDTTRELGGALGIALLGSIATSTYRDGLDLTGVPPETAAAASESVGAAVGVANRIGGTAGAELAAEAGRAFTNAFNITMATGAAIALLAGLVVFALSLRPDPAAAPHTVDVGPSAERLPGS